MSEQLEIAGLPERTPPTPLALMEKVIASGLTEQSVTVMERLVSLDREIRKDRAEQEFNAAFVRLQGDLPVIVASTPIPNRGKYERFEDVMRVVGPLLVRHGFSVSFSMDFKEVRVLEICTLKHTSGHSQSNSFAVRTGKADTETQADCKAATTAKRNALLNCLNIVIRQDVYQDEDGNAELEGSPIKPEAVQYLQEQVKEVGFQVESFLTLAGVKTFPEITTGKYPVLINAIEMKRRTAR